MTCKLCHIKSKNLDYSMPMFNGDYMTHPLICRVCKRKERGAGRWTVLWFRWLQALRLYK